MTLLPTPRASENENRQTRRTPSQEAGTHGKCLAAEVAHLLPTPTVADARGTRNFQPDGTPYSSGYGITLTDATMLLPTLVASDGERRSATYSRGNPTLTGALLPTPRATDGTKGGPNQGGSSGDLTLPSTAHRVSTGASTSPPSAAGNTSSDDPHPGQPTLWDA